MLDLSGRLFCSSVHASNAGNRTMGWCETAFVPNQSWLSNSVWPEARRGGFIPSVLASLLDWLEIPIVGQKRSVHELVGILSGS